MSQDNFLYLFYNSTTDKTAIFVNIEPPFRMYGEPEHDRAAWRKEREQWLSELLLVDAGDIEWGGCKEFSDGCYHLPAETVPAFVAFFQNMQDGKRRRFRWEEK
jgi:hypothetical protein